MSVLARRLVGEASDEVKAFVARAHASTQTQKYALRLDGWKKPVFLRPRVRYVGGGGYEVDDLYMSDLHEQPSFYTFEEAKAIKEVFGRKYGHIHATLSLVPERFFKRR